jgi:hypothetical protein
VECGGAVLIGLPPIHAWRYDDLPIGDDLEDDLDLPFEEEPTPPRERPRSPGSPSQAA